ncbi:MAG: hypothetical protein Q8Q12_05790, partial [bacterium]|nr:hypothetical protein [bacterium]
IARYGAARELTEVERVGNRVTFRAPFATKRFTARVQADPGSLPRLILNGKEIQLRRAKNLLDIESGTWHADNRHVTFCFDLPKGEAIVEV